METVKFLISRLRRRVNINIVSDILTFVRKFNQGQSLRRVRLCRGKLKCIFESDIEITKSQKEKIERIAEMLSSALPMMSVEVIELRKRRVWVLFSFILLSFTLIAILLIGKSRHENLYASDSIQSQNIKSEYSRENNHDENFLPKFKFDQTYDVFDYFRKCAPLSIDYFKAHCWYVKTSGDYKIIGVLDPDKDSNVPIMVSYAPENFEGLFNIDFIVQGIKPGIITEIDEGVRLRIEGEVDDISKSEGPGLLINANIVMFHTDIEKYRDKKRAEEAEKIEKTKSEEKIKRETTIPYFLRGKWSSSKKCDDYEMHDHNSRTTFIKGIDDKPRRDSIYLVSVGGEYFDVYTSFSKFTRYRRVGNEGYELYMVNTTNGPFYPKNPKAMNRCN